MLAGSRTRLPAAVGTGPVQTELSPSRATSTSAAPVSADLLPDTARVQNAFRPQPQTLLSKFPLALLFLVGRAGFFSCPGKVGLLCLPGSWNRTRQPWSKTRHVSPVGAKLEVVQDGNSTLASWSWLYIVPATHPCSCASRLSTITLLQGGRRWQEC